MFNFLKKLKIEKAIELEKGKCYLFKVDKIGAEYLDQFAKYLSKQGITGIIYAGNIEIIIPKQEEIK